MTNESRLVDSADVEEIQQRLDALENEEAMDVGVLDGFLTAAALAPEPVTEEDLLPYIFNAEGDPEAVPEDARLLELIDARRREIAASLAAGYGLDPVILPPEDEEDLRKLEEIHYTLEPWCMGFMMGSTLFWGEEVSESEDVLKLLAPMMSHLDPESFEDPETALAHINRFKGADPKDVEDALLAVVESVFSLKKVLCPNVPVKNEGPKVGRNDPCPCGSGKKWKQCCGKN